MSGYVSSVIWLCFAWRDSSGHLVSWWLRQGAMDPCEGEPFLGKMKTDRLRNLCFQPHNSSMYCETTNLAVRHHFCCPALPAVLQNFGISSTSPWVSILTWSNGPISDDLGYPRNLRICTQYVHMIWVNLITTSLFSLTGIIFFLGKSSPFMAQKFRLVKYYNLRRYDIYIYWYIYTDIHIYIIGYYIY